MVVIESNQEPLLLLLITLVMSCFYV